MLLKKVNFVHQLQHFHQKLPCRPYLDSCGTWNGARLVAGDSMDWFKGTFTGKPQKIMAGWWFGTFYMFPYYWEQ